MIDHPFVRIYNHPDFDVVERGEENLFIISDGHRSGTIFTDPKDYDHLTDDHLFIRTKNKDVLDRFLSIEEELKELGNYYSRVRHCHLVDVVHVYTRKYGRPNSLEI